MFQIKHPTKRISWIFCFEKLKKLQHIKRTSYYHIGRLTVYPTRIKRSITKSILKISKQNFVHKIWDNWQ